MLRGMFGADPAQAAQVQYATIQAQLMQLKSSPILNPHFNMVDRYLDCLNRFMDAIIAVSGPGGRRTFQRMPLTAKERQGILSFCTYWRRKTQPPFLMGRPECQIVLMTLQEYIQRLP